MPDAMSAPSVPAPRVSVAMSVYNDVGYVAQAVESVLTQDFGDFEFLIVDDGSTDGSGEVLEALAAKDHRIRLFRRENRGLVASLNQMIDEARGDLIARMDGDDLCLPGRFAAQVAFLDAHPEVGALGTQFYEIDGEGQLGDTSFRHPTEPEALRGVLAHQPPICHPSAMIRTSLLRELGGYRPVFRHCEDYDLFLRLSRRTDLANLPDVLLHYRRWGNQVSVLHNLAQSMGAAIAWEAHRSVLAGRGDPIIGLTQFPPIEQLDALFGRTGVSEAVRIRLVDRLRYSPKALRGDDYEMMRAHVAAGGTMAGPWRTVARLVRLGLPWRAARLAAALVRGRFARPAAPAKPPAKRATRAF